MEELIELLEEIQPDADFENCDTLIDDGILDSFAILSIVSELQDTYDITITPADIIPENFNSAKALWILAAFSFIESSFFPIPPDILKRSFSEFETSERDSQDGAGSQGGEYASEGAFKHFRFFLF